MFSNVIRNIDTTLLKQQEKALSNLIIDEKIPLNHPLVGLLGLVTGLLIERAIGGERVDVSMNYWIGENGKMCIKFHSSLYSENWKTLTTTAMGLLLSAFPPDMSLKDYLSLVEEGMEKMTLVRFGEIITTE